MRTIPDPGYPGDDGSVPPEASAALAAYADDRRLYNQTLMVLQDVRLLVPVVAVPGQVAVDERGLVHDKTSEMATVLLRNADGRTALLAFTGADPMRRWDPDARPVPVSARRAAEAARQDEAAALLVDVAGPTMFVIEGDDLAELASGHRLVELSGRFGWGRPAR